MRVKLGLIGAALLAAALTACSSNGGEAASQPAQRQATPTASAEAVVGEPVSVKISNSSLGPILTDQDGRTLYAFTWDKGGTSSCTADCIALWPALISQAPVSAGNGAKSALLGKTERAEGAVQATYGEWPLYYYVGDRAPGDVDGQGVDGVWFVVNADGKLVRAQ
jgi:predicted lipoprotein with Yx(FWY)xxD motif